MLKLFKKKDFKINVVAPISGKTISLEDVPDEIFSEKMLGDGLAIIPDDEFNTIVSPVDGTITVLNDNMLHAIGFTLKGDIEILIHYGLETVGLKEGFTPLISQGDKVKSGQPIMKLNREIMKAKQVNEIVPIVITKCSDYSYNLISSKKVTAGDNIIMSFERN